MGVGGLNRRLDRHACPALQLAQLGHLKRHGMVMVSRAAAAVSYSNQGIEIYQLDNQRMTMVERNRRAIGAAACSRRCCVTAITSTTSTTTMNHQQRGTSCHRL